MLGAFKRKSKFGGGSLSYFSNVKKDLEKNLTSSDKHSVVGRINRFLAKYSFGFKTKRSIYRRMATLNRQGLPTTRALSMLYAHASDDGRKPNNEIAIIIADWMTEVNAGKKTGTAFSKWIKRDEVALIDAGEKSGKLADAFENALFIQESMRDIKSTIRKAMATPGIIVFGIIGLLLLWRLYIIPVIETGMGSSTPQWTGITALVINMANGFYDMAPVLLTVLVSSIIALAMSMPRMTGKFRVILDRYPPFSFYRLATGANFMISIGSLLAAGVPVHEALKDLLRNNITPYYSERVKSTLRHVLAGNNFGDALLMTKLEFPDLETVRDLRTYAEMGVLEEKLEKMSKETVQENLEKIRSQAAIVNFVSMVVGAIFLALVSQATVGMQFQVAASVR
jgi:type II secretory pathway component PulF